MRLRLVGIVVLASCLCGLAGARADETLRIAKEAQALYDLDINNVLQG